MALILGWIGGVLIGAAIAFGISEVAGLGQSGAFVLGVLFGGLGGPLGGIAAEERFG